MKQVDEGQLSSLLRRAVPDPPVSLPFEVIVKGAKRQHLLRSASVSAAVLAVILAAAALPVLRGSGHSSPKYLTVAPGSRGASATGSDSAGQTCQAGGLVLVLRWTLEGEFLLGELTATNATSRNCVLPFKPVVEPLGLGGSPLPVQHFTRDDALIGPNVLRPSATALARVYWGSWCGATASHLVRVSWPGGGSVGVAAQGPASPPCSGAGHFGVESTWFEPRSTPSTSTR